MWFLRTGQISLQARVEKHWSKYIGIRYESEHAISQGEISFITMKNNDMSNWLIITLIHF